MKLYPLELKLYVVCYIFYPSNTCSIFVLLYMFANKLCKLTIKGEINYIYYVLLVVFVFILLVILKMILK